MVEKEIRKRLKMLKESEEIRVAFCGYLKRRAQIEREYADELFHLASLHAELSTTLIANGFHS